MASAGSSTRLDLDSVQFGGELVVDGERMAALDLLGLGLLGEHPLGGLPAGQRLQRPHQLPLGDVRLLLDLLQRVEDRTTTARRRSVNGVRWSELGSDMAFVGPAPRTWTSPGC